MIVACKSKEGAQFLYTARNCPVRHCCNLVQVCRHTLSSYSVPQIGHLPSQELALCCVELQTMLLKPCQYFVESYQVFNVAKCNLGKVNLETMLASGLLSCVA